MTDVVDARGVRVRSDAQRIVSLVPSTTETLFALGVGERVVGVTRFCVAPSHARRLPKVGGTKDVITERVLALSPDLVVANCEENTREIFASLEAHVPVFAAFPRTVDDAIADVHTLGRLLDCSASAAAWATRVDEAREALQRSARPFRFAYLIWREPWMAVGADTFIHAMIAEAGGTNVLAASEDRFPTFELPALQGCDRVLLSSEPFPFAQQHIDELCRRTGLPAERFRLVDGAYCSWHGTRVLAGLGYLRQAALSS